jgi:hypothetical protein
MLAHFCDIWLVDGRVLPGGAGRLRGARVGLREASERAVYWAGQGFLMFPLLKSAN